MNDKTTFEVTEKAGLFVAGVRSPGVGKTVDLSEDQAHYALISGELVRPAEKAPAPRKTESKAE